MKMNLTTDPWIPVVWNDGRAGMVSLLDAFQQGEDIQDLAVRPHERIALMRLLICIAQAALDGPDDRADWQTCRPRIAPAGTTYLKKWQHAFELFGDGQRFLQVNNLKPDGKADEDDEGGSNVSKLDLALATGSNATLFDNAGGTERVFSPAQIALNLLSYQCFSPLVGRGYLGRSPCVEKNMLHTLLKADTLIETIRLNMLSKDTVALCFGENGWGVPVWESMATSAEKNATETYLGRMAPVIRAIRLGDDCVTMELGNGLTYPIVREPMATIRIIQRNGNPERDFLAGDLNKAIWRELHAIVVKRVADNGVGGPLALRNLEVGKPFDLWVGGVVTDRKAKVFDALESLFSFPDGLPSDDQLAIGLALYQQGVEFAESTERRLRSAITMYYVALQKGKQRAEEIRAAFRSLKPKERQSLGELTAKAQTDFWSLVEVGQRDLQKFAISDVPMNGNQISYSETAWGKRVLRAASEAYAAACSQETARQLQAFVLGKEELFRPRPNTDEKKETTA